MLTSLNKIEGRKFCVVFVKVIDATAGKVQLQCMRGRASVDNGRVSVIDEHGASFQVPGTATQNILPSDGTEILKDAEYYCLIRVDDHIDLSHQEQECFDVEAEECHCHNHEEHGECHCHHHDK